jgi:hypothetical protein
MTIKAELSSDSIASVVASTVAIHIGRRSWRCAASWSRSVIHRRLISNAIEAADGTKSVGVFAGPGLERCRDGRKTHRRA